VLFRSVTDNATLDIHPIAPGGPADAAAQDTFCGNNCVVQIIYDQTPFNNTMHTAPAGGHVHTPDAPVNASALSAMVGGHRVYGAYFTGGMGYRILNTTGVARDNDPETIYMVTSGVPEHVNSRCCFD
jgi:hypothetical protein